MVITALIGPKAREFPIKAAILSYDFPKFGKALQGDSISLFGVDEVVFEAFHCWIMRGSLCISVDGSIPLPNDLIVDIYYFALIWDIHGFANAAISLLYQKIFQDHDPHIPFWIVREAYLERTMPAPVLRRFLVDLVATTWTFNVHAHQDQLNLEFLCDLIMGLRDKKIVPGTACRCTRDLWYEQMNKYGLCDKYHYHPTPKNGLL
jgi:hypothetical protein